MQPVLTQVTKTASVISVCRRRVNPVVSTCTAFSHETERLKHSKGVSDAARLAGGGPLMTVGAQVTTQRAG